MMLRKPPAPLPAAPVGLAVEGGAPRRSSLCTRTSSRTSSAVSADRWPSLSSFRLTFVGFLDQRLASELYVSAEDAQQAQDLAIWLEDRVDAVLPIQSAQITAAGLPTEVFGTRDHATYRDNWVFLDSTPDAWDAVFNGTAVAVNEQLARRAGLWVGETVRIGQRDLPIAGVYGDYGNPIGQAVISEALFEVLYPTVTPLRLALPASIHGSRSAGVLSGKLSRMLPMSPFGSRMSVGVPPSRASSSMFMPSPVLPEPVMPKITPWVVRALAFSNTGSPPSLLRPI